MNMFLANKKSIMTSLLIVNLLLIGCGNSNGNATNNTLEPTVPKNNEVATQVFKNGKIYTVNELQEWADAVAIKDNKIIFVGSNDDVESYVDSTTKVTDLSGKMMMPGFHDVHMHPIESASENTHFAISAQVTNPENYIDEIIAASTANPGSGWLIGFGHSIFTLLEASRPPIDILDEAVPDRPVIIMDHTSHSMWVNSAALTVAGFRGFANIPSKLTLGYFIIIHKL